MRQSGAFDPEQQQLRWRCRRGLLELDLLFEAFLNDGFDRLTPAARTAFARLLAYPDPLLHDWLVAGAVPEDPALRALIAAVRAAAKAPK